MSAGQESQVSPQQQQMDNARRQLLRLRQEIAQLSEAELSPPEYYGEFLQRVMTAIGAPAGAVWVRTPQGNFQLQYQINMRQVGLDKTDTGRQMHGELLRQFALKGQPAIAPPNSSMGNAEDKAPIAGNTTDFVVLLAPILYDKQVAGIVEVWNDPKRGADGQNNALRFLVEMAALASAFTRNHQLRQMVGQQQVWLQLETFAKQIHGSLNPTEVAYVVANEGRRLIDCDRVSVAQREGPQPKVLAISGADVVETRSNLVQLMKALFDAVMDWGERLVYTGAKDDALPPKVNKALDAYLAESNSKLMVLLPLKDERETDKKVKPRSGLLMECFETNATAEQLLAKMEVIGKHAATALYNAGEYRRIPGRFIWLPMAKLQDGLGGKAKAIVTLVGLGLGLLIAAMIFVPYPLKMDGKGQVLPKDRGWLYAPQAGQIREIKAGLQSGSPVGRDEVLIILFDGDLQKNIKDLQLDIAQASLILKQPDDPANPEIKKNKDEARVRRDSKIDELKTLRQRTNSLDEPGYFSVKSPIAGIVLTADFRENLLNKWVRPNEQLLRIGTTDQMNPRLEEWEIELKIPQKHVGQVLEAFNRLQVDELDVDLLLTTNPITSYRGKVHKNKVARQANPNRDDNNETDPVVMAWVRISGDDIPKGSQIPTSQLLTGTEVHARVRCGNAAMGYSLFYGVWEFLYEKVIFFF